MLLEVARGNVDVADRLVVAQGHARLNVVASIAIALQASNRARVELNQLERMELLNNVLRVGRVYLESLQQALIGTEQAFVWDVRFVVHEVGDRLCLSWRICGTAVSKSWCLVLPTAEDAV